MLLYTNIVLIFGIYIINFNICQAINSEINYGKYNLIPHDDNENNGFKKWQDWFYFKNPNLNYEDIKKYNIVSREKREQNEKETNEINNNKDTVEDVEIKELEDGLNETRTGITMSAFDVQAYDENNDEENEDADSDGEILDQGDDYQNDSEFPGVVLLDINVSSTILNKTNHKDHHYPSDKPIPQPPVATSSSTNKKYFYPLDILGKFKPVEVFKPIAEKFGQVVGQLYPVQPYINNELYSDGYQHNLHQVLAVPGLFLEKLHRKGQHFLSSAHGAVFGFGHLSDVDYPFAFRSLNNVEGRLNLTELVKSKLN